MAPTAHAWKLAVVAIAVSTSSTAAQPKLSREQMMPIVRKATWSFCHQPKRSIVDCHLSLMFIDGHWSVIASPVFQQPGGKPVCCVVDQDAIFDFSPSEKLIRTIRAD